MNFQHQETDEIKRNMLRHVLLVGPLSTSVVTITAIGGLSIFLQTQLLSFSSYIRKRTHIATNQVTAKYVCKPHFIALGIAVPIEKLQKGRRPIST